MVLSTGKPYGERTIALAGPVSRFPAVTALARAILFTSAFLPVFPLIAFRSWTKNQALAVGFIGIAVVVGLATIWLMVLLGKGTPRIVTVATATSGADSVVAFITGYLLPVSLIDGSDISVVIVNAAAYLFLLLVAVRTNLVYFNPLLALFGFHLFEIETAPAGAGAAERRTLLVNSANVPIGTRLAIYGAAGSIERAKVV